MPHIYATRETDAYFGLGYALAEDRLEQVLLNYLMVQGRLAESFGPGPLKPAELSPGLVGIVPDTVASDLAMRREGALQAARVNLRRLPPGYGRNVEAYAAGFRRYMIEHPERTPAWAPHVEAAMPLALYATQTSGSPETPCRERLARPMVLGLEERLDRASNAWALSGARTADGNVIFSSDSHGGLFGLGPTFYAWRMKAGAMNVFANDFTGSIAMVLAHSGRFGWGWTEGPRLPADCYAVRTIRSDPGTYRYDGHLRHFEREAYEIKVKGAKPLTGFFEYTRHNGVRSAVFERQGETAYLVSSAYSERAGLAEAQYYAMAKARDSKQFMRALAPREIYPANLIVGGADGTILYIRPGRIPIRRPGVSATAMLDGNTSATSWAGIHPLADLVQLQNPPQGWVGNTNVSPDMMYATPLLKPERYPAYFAFLPGQTNSRQQRLIELLDHADHVTVQDAIAIAMDDKILGTDLWGPAIRAAVAVRGPEFPRGAEAEAFVQELAAFDGFFRVTSRGAAYHEAFREALVEMSPLRVDSIVTAVENGGALSTGDSKLVATAVGRAFDTLRAAYGVTPLAYGDIHRARRGGVDGPAGGAVIVAGVDLFNHRRLAIEGRTVSVRAALHANIFTRDAADGRRVLSAGTRAPFVVSFGNPVRSYGLLAYGASNRPGARFFANQLPLVGEETLKSNFFDPRELVGSIAENRLLTTAVPP